MDELILDGESETAGKTHVIRALKTTRNVGARALLPKGIRRLTALMPKIAP
jgi:hypothetical protein